MQFSINEYNSNDALIDALVYLIPALSDRVSFHEQAWIPSWHVRLQKDTQVKKNAFRIDLTSCSFRAPCHLMNYN